MKLTCFVFMASLTAATAAFAQTSNIQGTPAPAECQSDAQKLCSDQVGAARRQCLVQNEDKVSPACKTALAAPPPGGMAAAMGSADRGVDSSAAGSAPDAGTFGN